MNAKDELLGAIKDYKVIGASVQFGDSYDDNAEHYLLPLLYGDKEWNEFMNFMDRDYDNSFGGQELFGIILCEDSIWFERGEYDGSEWWQKNQYPDLSEIFDNKLVLKYERHIKLKKISEKNH